VTGGVDFQDRIVISTYPARAKTRNAESDPRVSVLVLSDDWSGPWVQIDGDAKVLHMPEAADGLVDSFHARSEQVADPDHPNSLGSRPGDFRPRWPRDSIAELL
jgi:Pyridoxamine 5'-phosphate oxidase